MPKQSIGNVLVVHSQRVERAFCYSSGAGFAKIAVIADLEVARQNLPSVKASVAADIQQDDRGTQASDQAKDHPSRIDRAVSPNAFIANEYGIGP